MNGRECYTGPWMNRPPRRMLCRMRRAGRSASLLALAATVLASCSGGNSGPVIRQGGTLYVALDGDPVSLNPLIANDPVSSRAYAPLFPLLYTANADLSVGPDLANALPAVTASGTVLTVPLHRDAKWSDGLPITADDVVFTVATEMDPSFATHASFDWSDLQAVTKVDQFTVKFTLKRADSAFTADSLVTPIVPQHAFAHLKAAQIASASFNAGPTVSGGAFMFDHRVAGQAIYLKANPDYFLGNPHLDRVVEVVQPDPSRALNALENGKLTWAPHLSADLAVSAVSIPGVIVSGYPATNLVALMFNVRPGRLFADRVVREAFAYSVGHDAVVGQATGSAQGFPVWGDVNPHSWAFDQSAPSRYAQDSGRARRLLTGAGWSIPNGGVATFNGRPLSATILFPTSDASRARVASALAQQSKGAGFGLSAQGLDDAALGGALSTGNFDAALVSLGTGLDPDGAAYLASRGPLNYGGYSSASLDRLLLADLAATPSASGTLQQVRKPILSHIEQVVSTDLPMYFLWVPREFTGFNATLGGVAGAGAQLDLDRSDTFYRDWYLM
jgi:peptide/nickel transport system substrate-binding protein